MFADTPEQKDRVFLILTGIWLFTALLLFGNPVILDYLHPPKNIGIPTESIGVTPEDDSNARPYLGILAVLGLACVLGFSRLAKPKFQLPAALPRWIAWLPLGWFGWQLASLFQTVDRGDVDRHGDPLWLLCRGVLPWAVCAGADAIGQARPVGCSAWPDGEPARCQPRAVRWAGRNSTSDHSANRLRQT